MTPQFLSEKMSRHLSSLVPGFEGHYVYVKIGPINEWRLMCRKSLEKLWESAREEVCPAWQVEDVLRNLANILLARKNKRMGISSILKVIVTEFAIAPDTAYQKIEEYLWSILK